MAHGAYSVFTKTFVSGATSHASGVDLGRSWHRVKLDIPARSNTTIYIKGAADDLSTYRRVYADGNATTAPALFQIASAATNAIVPIPGGYRFVKVETQDLIADGTVFKFICSDV